MPGLTIHIAVAKQYINKHKNEIKDEKQFINGAIAPDLNEEMNDICKDKSLTHYGEWRRYHTEMHIDRFLADTRVNMNEDYWKGYFLHLLTDYYFYMEDFSYEISLTEKYNDSLYNDFDCLNMYLLNRYNIEVLENIEKYMQKKNGNLKYLNLDKIINFIEKISDFDLNEKSVQLNNEYLYDKKEKLTIK